MEKLDHKALEAKWQAWWEDNSLHRTDLSNNSRKCYTLVMFIYPSGDKLHIGHWYNYGPTDTWARFRRMQGWNIFEPIGYDAFGMPAENYAIKHGVHPWNSTNDNISFIRSQLKAIGAMYDWTREVNTSAPEYYKWTQWIFLQLYKAGLAYRSKAPVNWCPSCQTVLANEQVLPDGACERCETPVTRKDLVQWFFGITRYADRLLAGLDGIDWPEKTKTMQRNWIGRSEGAEITFSFAPGTPGADSLTENELRFKVFTTRPDTLFGVTYVVMAPEHPLVERITTPERREEVARYIELARSQNEIQRTSTVKEKTGVFTGAYAVNPANGEKVPVWIADYVLASYGTGIVMAVPAHDERDFEFASRMNLPVREVIAPLSGPSIRPLESAYVEPGTMINSAEFNGRESRAGGRALVEKLKSAGQADFRINYKLRDWLISRQRYWGVPIPIVYCEEHGEVPIPEDQLPVLLPYEVDFKKAVKGVSPLATNDGFVNAVCPICGKPARREIDTMDTFVDSSWYFLRYPDPSDSSQPFNKELVSRWLPVDHYVGGAEHAVMHLLYARFVTKVLHDLGHITFEEPFTRLSHQGTITNQGAKMSKSRGNVINPEVFLDRYGADTFRCYLMFMGDYSLGGDWDDTGIQGMSRFINRVWRLVQFNSSRLTGVAPSRTTIQDMASLNSVEHEILRVMHNSIRGASEDLERMHFNTALSRIMELVNVLVPYAGEDAGNNQFNPGLLAESLDVLVKLLAPFAPHICEELWQSALGRQGSVFQSSWPGWDKDILKEDVVTVVVQVNGKLRSHLEAPRGLPEDKVREIALKDEKVARYMENVTIRKIIYVQDKLINFVAS